MQSCIYKQDTEQNMYFTEIIQKGMKVNDRQDKYRYIVVSLISVILYRYIGVSLISVNLIRYIGVWLISVIRYRYIIDICHLLSIYRLIIDICQPMSIYRYITAMTCSETMTVLVAGYYAILAEQNGWTYKLTASSADKRPYKWLLLLWLNISKMSA
jgi:hypothetical protein